MLADSPEAQIVAQLAPVEGEPVIDKGCVDPFVGTPLREVLAAEGITEVVLGGVATNLVVESAARHASDAGLQVTVVEDMCASFRADFHDFSVQNMLPLFGTVTTSADLLGRPVMTTSRLRRRRRRRRRRRPDRGLRGRRGTAPGSRSWSGPPRPRPAATPATPRRSCG